jgi:diaminohydroxyphosphoribosylaminopyrimidine deaminase/5-amino-6-(5-phosphoribosylamino)uracil reductase
VQAIISAGVREVQIAVLDANARVNGDGRNLLEAAGIATKTGDREEEAREVVEAHFKWINTREPFVSVKYAMSSDGKIATTTGDSRWITGEGARTYTHRLRRACDAIMIGGGTALRDDPQLTARDSVEAVAFQPLRVIVDSHGLLPTDARLLKQPGNVLVAVAGATPERESALRAVGADVLRLPDNEGRVDIRALLKDLGGRQVTSLLVEGGGTLIASLVEAGLVDKIYAFIAPLVIGGAEAPTPVDGHGALRIVEARRLERVRWKEFGEDMLLIGYPSAR